MAKTIDANQADFGAVGTSFIAHGGQGARRVIKDHVALAGVVASPPCESFRDALEPLRASALGVAIVGVLRVG
jgi:hypothetical protein